MDAVQTLQLDGSLFVGMTGNGGRWRDAEWSATISDPATGELLVTAINAQHGDEPAMVAFRLGREFLLSLRGLAGIDGPLPADEARGELAYLRESVQFAVNILAQGRTLGQDYRQAAWNTESYLRQLLALDAEQEQPGYDVEHACNGVRFAELEQQISIQKQRINGLTKRMDETQKMISSLHEHQVLDARRMEKLETALMGDADRYGNLVRRVEDLENARQPVPSRAWEDAIESRLAELEALAQCRVLYQRLDALEQGPRYTMHDQQRVDDIVAKLRETIERVGTLEGRMARAEERDSALVDQIRAEAQGNIAAFAAIGRTCNRLDVRLQRVVDVLRERGMPVEVHDGSATNS